VLRGAARCTSTYLDRIWRRGAQEIVLAHGEDFKSYWAGISIDVVDSSIGSVTIYNPMGASHASSEIAYTAIAKKNSSLG
jgi:hypothetical protein